MPLIETKYHGEILNGKIRIQLMGEKYNEDRDSPIMHYQTFH